MRINVYVLPDGELLTEFDKGHQYGRLFASTRLGMNLRYVPETATEWREIVEKGERRKLYKCAGRDDVVLYSAPYIKGKAHVAVDVYANLTTEYLGTYDFGIYRAPMIDMNELPDNEEWIKYASTDIRGIYRGEETYVKAAQS